jgi:hypothetical protein
LWNEPIKEAHHQKREKRRWNLGSLQLIYTNHTILYSKVLQIWSPCNLWNLFSTKIGYFHVVL